MYEKYKHFWIHKLKNEYSEYDLCTNILCIHPKQDARISMHFMHYTYSILLSWIYKYVKFYSYINIQFSCKNILFSAQIYSSLQECTFFLKNIQLS